MEHRNFFVALGVPKGADTDAVQVAYRKVVARYREALEPAEEQQQPTQGLASFAVVRTYSERRHAALFEQQGPAVPLPTGEVDRFYGGYVPEVPLGHRATPVGKDLFVELRISAEDARRGGIHPVHIPVVRACPGCHGTDERSRLICRSCHGTGSVTDDHMVEVTVPPRVEQGQLARLAMEDVGLGSTELIVRIVLGSAT